MSVDPLKFFGMPASACHVVAVALRERAPAQSKADRERCEALADAFEEVGSGEPGFSAPPRTQAIEAIRLERQFQDAKWGTLDDHPHTAGEWFLILESEVADGKAKWFRDFKTLDGSRLAWLKIAAVALAAMEQHGTPDTTERHSGVRQ